MTCILHLWSCLHLWLSATPEARFAGELVCSKVGAGHSLAPRSVLPATTIAKESLDGDNLRILIFTGVARQIRQRKAATYFGGP